MIDPNDDLGEMLAPRPGEAPAGLRDRLLRQTQSRLQRQVWVRRGLRVGLAAAIFLAGGLTGWLVHQTPANESVPQPEKVFVAVPVAVPLIVESGSSAVPEMPQPLSGSQTELRAEQEDDPASAARLYRTAGDAFLREQDYANATRCYRIYLVRGGDAALSLAADDSWLLISLKNAAFQEKSRVSQNDS